MALISTFFLLEKERLSPLPPGEGRVREND